MEFSLVPVMVLCVAIITVLDARVAGSRCGNICEISLFVRLICCSVSNTPILERINVMLDTFNGISRGNIKGKCGDFHWLSHGDLSYN